MKNRAWGGDYFFLLSNLMQKDFKIRYRNMSLGVFWSLLNPLVTMGVLTFVFTQLFPNPRPAFPLFVLCGIIPFNFFSFAWSVGTNSIIDSQSFVKRVAVPREIIPVASVFSNGLHLLIQVGLLLCFAIYYKAITIHWLWLPVVWGLEFVFVIGLTLITSSINVFVRDMRYVVESLNVVLFWLIPIVYDFKDIPQKFSEVYRYNPMAAIVLALRRVLYEGSAPLFSTMANLCALSFLTLIIGVLVFRFLRPKFYDYL